MNSYEVKRIKRFRVVASVGALVVVPLFGASLGWLAGLLLQSLDVIGRGQWLMGTVCFGFMGLVGAITIIIHFVRWSRRAIALARDTEGDRHG